MLVRLDLKFEFLSGFESGVRCCRSHPLVVKGTYHLSPLPLDRARTAPDRVRMTPDRARKPDREFLRYTKFKVTSQPAGPGLM